nr:L-galactose dehydrogenase-like isoform X3 [Nomia melanderi]
MKMLPPTYVEGFHDLEAVKAMEYRPLGKTGLLVSKLAMGGALFSNIYGTFDEEEAIEMIRQGIKRGINYIDTAPWYGQYHSETVIGKALKGIPREAYYIATKVGKYELDYKNMFDFSKEKTRKSFQKSLRLLGLDYVDIIQIHDIEFAPSLDIIITQTLPEVSTQVAEDDTLMEYISYFKAKNIGVINAALTCMGLLTNNGPPAWHLSLEKTKQICSDMGKYCKERDTELAKLAIWYSMQSEDISTHLIGMNTLKHLHMNFDILQNGITEREKTILKEIQEKYVSTITDKHWDNKEVEAYWENMKK